MITLVQFPPGFGMRTTSPFGLKLETWMRLAEVPYAVKAEPAPQKGPKKKIPFIVDEAVVIGDSALIIEHLERKHGDPVDGHLSPLERARGRAIRRMAEEGLHFVNTYHRWIDPAGLAVTSPVFLGGAPAAIRPLIARFARRPVVQALWAQGTGRHSPEEIAAIGRADVTALADLLGDQADFLGERPASVDAAVYGILLGMLKIPLETPVRTHLLAQPNLVAFCDRVRARCFPDEA